MAKVASKVVNFSYNSVALETFVDSLDLNLNVATPEVTGFGDTGPKRVEDNYDWDFDLKGPAGFAAGESDATLFGRLGNGGAAADFDPTGTAAGASAPHYTSTSSLLQSYKISTAMGRGVTYSAKLTGNSALVRATS